jgi:hypothetical protein
MQASAPRRILQSILFGALLLIAEAIWAQLAPGTPPKAPKELQPPTGEVLLLHLKGKGNQIYVCQNAAGSYAWKLKAPDAKLLGDRGELAGRHFAGPTWEATDGSRVVGKLVATVPSPESGSIPWLLVTAASHDGAGIMARVQTIQRLETKGGIAPATGCGATSANEEVAVPYEANYYFYGEPR